MKKEIITVSIILVATIILNIITQTYTNKTVKYMDEKLQEVCELVQEDFDNKTNSKFDLINQKITNLDNEWNEKNKNLAYYIEHDELEKVDTSMVTLKEYISINNYEEALPELKKCEFILNHIKDKEVMTIINLF